MTPERLKIAQAKFHIYASNQGLHGGSPLSLARYEGSKDGYLRGFHDGVEEILTSSPTLAMLEQSIQIKDIRLEILEKENKAMNIRLEHRKKLQEDTRDELKTVIDRLTLLIGLRDPALIDQMTAIRKSLEV